MDVFPMVFVIGVMVAVCALQTYLTQRRSTAVDAIASQIGLEFLGNSNPLIPDIVFRLIQE